MVVTESKPPLWSGAIPWRTEDVEGWQCLEGVSEGNHLGELPISKDLGRRGLGKCHDRQELAQAGAPCKSRIERLTDNGG